MAPQTDLLKSLLEYVSADERVCPQPDYWNQLWEMLPNKERDGVGWVPPAPLILAAWWESTDSQKISRLRLHLEYAADNGVLDVVDQFLRDLPKDGWHMAQGG